MPKRRDMLLRIIREQRRAHNLPARGRYTGKYLNEERMAALENEVFAFGFDPATGKPLELDDALEVSPAPAPASTFPERLAAAMTAKRLSASDVARRVWGSRKDSRGYNVASNRDMVGHYLRGTLYPQPQTMEKLAAAVGLSVDELAGPPDARPFVRPRPSALPSITSIPDEPGKVWLDIGRRVLPMQVAVEIFTKIMEHERGPDDGETVRGA